MHVLPQWLKVGYLYLFTYTSNKYDSDICSLDITKKHLVVSQKHCLVTRIILKSDINHVKCNITKIRSFIQNKRSRNFVQQ